MAKNKRHSQTFKTSQLDALLVEVSTWVEPKPPKADYVLGYTI